MDQIKFANGQVYDCSYIATLPEQHMAFVAVDGVTFAEAAAIFSDPNMTSEMQINDWILYDYTDLQYVMKESYGFKACLTGGHEERRS